MSWTEERIDQLKRLWGQGMTASQIADELGGVSRNAVIGKAHRLGLEARPSPVKGGDAAASGGSSPAAATPAPEKAAAPPPRPAPTPAPGRRSGHGRP
ncbi:GcrA family cell cycle regulator, partial [Rhizorhabdus histidinilytica]|uniref:GcrA family cell cycle regulator n=1 Tax=Rhizorhabdus histidinilytica TaxID=439228 RepID=UPI0035F007A7